MRKILFHLNCFEQGGAERVVSNLVNQLVHDNYDIITATEWHGKTEFELDKKVRRIHVGLHAEDQHKSKFIRIWLRLYYLHKLIQEEKPDLVVSFTRKPNYRALAAAIGTGVPVIAAVRQDPASYYNSMVDKILIPTLFRRAAGCVFQTREQMVSFPKSLQKRSRIILNPVHDKYLNTPEPEQREKTVVQSGRLVDFKNQAMLLRAFLDVHEKHPDYSLRIYGGDSFDGTKEQLEDIISQNRAEGFISLMGASDRLEKELPKASVYAFSSDYEGMPNALLEALALGMPVVATDCPCGGPRDLIENGKNGLLIPVGDQKAMENGINRLIEEKDFAAMLGKNARRIGDRANNQAIALQWKEYMEEIIQKKQRHRNGIRRER